MPLWLRGTSQCLLKTSRNGGRKLFFFSSSGAGSPYGGLEKSEFGFGRSIACITKISKPSSFPLYVAKVTLHCRSRGRICKLSKAALRFQSLLRQFGRLWNILPPFLCWACLCWQLQSQAALAWCHLLLGQRKAELLETCWGQPGWAVHIET